MAHGKLKSQLHVYLTCRGQLRIDKRTAHAATYPCRPQARCSAALLRVAYHKHLGPDNTFQLGQLTRATITAVAAFGNVHPSRSAMYYSP